LTEFLEQVALVSEVDNLTEEESAPSLLTLHAAKGLEFPVVFIVGVEDGILPHKRSWDDPEQMAEERRLFYVGMTRTKNKLYLLHCFRRFSWGNVDYVKPSRFLNDIPPNLIAGKVQPARELPSRTEWSSVNRSLPTPAWQAEVEERSKPAPAGPSYKTGQQVRHAAFGEGIVIEAKPADGDEIITVAFEGVGLKRLLASMAKLETL
jgi:DNA helicase-2/ATP-dependent DNA helicase PcrA